jgi:hypothetical protein
MYEASTILWLQHRRLRQTHNLCNCGENVDYCRRIPCDSASCNHTWPLKHRWHANTALEESFLVATQATIRIDAPPSGLSAIVTVEPQECVALDAQRTKPPP